MAMDPKQIAEAARALTDADVADLPPVDEAGDDTPPPAPKGKRQRIDTISEDEREAGEKPSKRARTDPEDEEDPPEDEDAPEGEDEETEDEEGEDDDTPDEKAAPTPARVAKAWNQVRRQMREIRAAKEQVAREKAEASQAIAQAQAVQANWEKLKTSPLRVLKAAGWDWEKLISHVAQHGDEGEPEPDPEVVALRQRLDAAEQKERTREAQSKIDEFKGYIREMVHAEDSPYPALKATKGEELIYETAREIFRKTGKVPDTAEVARRLEAQALEELKATLGNASLRKMLGLSGTVTPTDKRATTHPGTKPRTISSRRMGTARSTPRSDDDFGNDDDVEARAIAAFERAKRSG